MICVYIRLSGHQVGAPLLCHCRCLAAPVHAWALCTRKHIHVNTYMSICIHMWTLCVYIRVSIHTCEYTSRGPLLCHCRCLAAPICVWALYICTCIYMYMYQLYIYINKYVTLFIYTCLRGRQVGGPLLCHAVLQHLYMYAQYIYVWALHICK